MKKERRFIQLVLMVVVGLGATGFSNKGIEYEKEELVFKSEAEKRSIVGYWLDFNSRGKVSARIELYERGGKVYGRSVEIVDIENRLLRCTKCTDDRKDKVSLNLEFIRGLEKVRGKWDWKKGKILDPSSGDIYRMRAWTTEDGTKLKMRGYLGPFYQTRTWVRTQRTLGEEYGKITEADKQAYREIKAREEQ